MVWPRTTCWSVDLGIRSSARLQWGALVGGLLLLGAIVVAVLLLDLQHLLAAESDRLETQARVMEDNMARQFQAVDAGVLSVVRDFGYFESMSPDETLLTRRLQSLSDAMPGVRTLVVMDGNGNVLASNRPQLTGQNFAHRDYVQAILQRPDPAVLYLSSPFLTVLNVYSMNLVRVQVNEQGEARRLVVATLDPEFFEILMSSVLYADDMWSGLVYQNGLLAIVQPDRPDWVGSNLNEPGSPFQRHIESAKLGDAMDAPDPLSGERRLIALRSVQAKSLNMQGYVVVAVSRSRSAVLQGWYGVATSAAVIWALFSGSVLFGFGAFQRYRTQVRRLQEDKERLREQKEEEIRHLAFYDPLTHLPNRRMLMDRLQQTQSASLRHRRCSALFFIDLDDFKQLNDRHGHEQGDRLLCEVAQRLRSCVREEDTVARLGGDEFVVLLFELGGEAEEARDKAEAVARKVLDALAGVYLLGDLPYQCTASVGVTLFGLAPETLDAVLHRADRAMYDAKGAGRNAFRLDPGG